MALCTIEVDDVEILSTEDQAAADARFTAECGEEREGACFIVYKKDAKPYLWKRIRAPAV